MRTQVDLSLCACYHHFLSQVQYSDGMGTAILASEDGINRCPMDKLRVSNA